MKSLWLLSLAGPVLLIAGGLSAGRAEIAPDSTLPQSSRVNRAGSQTVITGGTQRGRNQFHSFRKFSVQSGEVASFQGIDPAISNLFVRVTGRSLSRINGVVEVLGTNQQISPANLFLINPNGISFGSNATLRIGGSLVATTAEAIRFADGQPFSAANPQAPPLLTVSTPVGLQFGNRPGRIVHQSLAELSAGLNQTLALVGGDLRLNGSQLSMEGGRIELGSVAESGVVNLTPIQSGWDLDFSGIRQWGNIQLQGSGITGREIQLQGNQIVVDGSFVNSEQAGGRIEIEAADSVVLQAQGNLTTQTLSNQPAGDIAISTARLILEGGSLLGSQTECSGACDNGQSGNVEIVASDQVVVSGIALSEVDGVVRQDPSQIFNQSQGSGATGTLSITTDRLQVQQGGQINTTTFQAGNAGDLIIQANQIDLVGLALTPNGRPVFIEGLPASGGLFVGTGPGSDGNGGTLRITTDRLRVQDGAILQATTYGRGNAGNIVIQATDSVEVTGASNQANIPARITATSGGIRGLSTAEAEQATGRGGNLTINTRQLRIADQGIIAVNSLNPAGAGAGSIQITANQITLNNRGQLNAQTESGDNPNLSINLRGVELLTLRGNSEISTSAGVLSGDGNGGDINISASVILDAPAEDSDISANAGRETAGNIRIDAQGILGIQEQDQNTPRSDITATAESGVNGEILINSPTLDPTQGIVELPSTVVDASRLIAQGCEARQRTATTELGEFVITGRGGVPPTPTDLRSSAAVITDWATLDTTPQSTRLSTQPQPPHQDTTHFSPADNELARSAAVVEAQGWIRDREGQVALVAQAGAGSTYPVWTVPACQDAQLQP
jgi:filamentous hemagglutinin family protein